MRRVTRPPDGTLDELTPEEYAALRADYVKNGKGTPPPGAEPLPEAKPEGEKPE